MGNKPTYAELEQQVKALKKKTVECTHDLGERVKKLNCIYNVSKLLGFSDFSFDENLQNIVSMLPKAWQYPEITCSRLTLESLTYTTQNFHESVWRQVSDIMAVGNQVGTLEVFYSEERPQRDEGPFLQEERELINFIAESLGRATARRKALEMLMESNAQIKGAMADLNKMVIKADRANMAKSEFLTNLSHEIRTPLYGITGMVELAGETNLDNGQKKIFHTIKKEGYFLLNLINKILDYSKIEAGKLDLEEIPFDMRYLIEDVTDSFAYRVEQKGLEITSFFPPDVQPLLVGDPGRLRQILSNFVGNALKFTNEGGISITGGLAEDLGDRVKIRFSVKDTGIGIPKEKHALIFETFTQADSTTTRKYGGTGLGTTISKQLAELMGGETGLESEEGKGSTFWFTAVFTKQAGPETSRKKERADLVKLKVLVVDDNPAGRSLLAKYLNRWGCISLEAPVGEEALSLLKESFLSKKPFDLILTAIQMPEMNGYDLVKAIKKVRSLKDIPIIVLTAFRKPGDGKVFKDMGVDGYLSKPIKGRQLLAMIKLVIGFSRVRGSTSPQLVTRHMLAEERRKKSLVLLVENHPTSQQITMKHLSGAGYQVDLAENGEQAMEAAKRKHYDLILMDIEMPVLDGYEATKAIRNLEFNLSKVGDKVSTEIKRVPIIAMTAHAVKSYIERVFEVGMDDYITKPCSKKELLAIVSKWAIPESRLDDCVDQEQSKSDDMEKDIPAEEDSRLGEFCPMNFDKALAEFESDSEFLMKVLNDFLHNTHLQIATIRKGILDGDPEVVRKEAHSIKGGAADLRADDLAETAYKLEHIGKERNLDAGIEVIEKLEIELNRLESFTRKKNESTHC